MVWVYEIQGTKDERINLNKGNSSLQSAAVRTSEENLSDLLNKKSKAVSKITKVTGIIKTSKKKAKNLKNKCYMWTIQVLPSTLKNKFKKNKNQKVYDHATP